MRVLGVLAAWGVLAVLATLCFAVGGSIGYRRGVQDAVRQVRERRNSKAECRPLPLARHRQRSISRMRARAATQLRRPREAHATTTAQNTAASAGGITGLRLSPAVVGAVVAVCLMVVPGVAVGATTAQPGDTLWPVKRKVEDVRLATAMSPGRRVAVHVDIAAHRLTELNALLSRRDAEPEVVDEVIGGLRKHTEAANQEIREVPITEGPPLAQRVNRVVGRQVAVLDLLLGIDCGQERNQQCVALSDTRAVSVELQRTANEIAMAGEQVGAADPAVDPVSEPAQVTSAPVAAASGPAAAVASEEPTATASPTSSPEASAAPSPSASEGAPDDGEATPPDAGTPSDSAPSRDSATPAHDSGPEPPADNSETTTGRASDAATAVVEPLTDAVEGLGELP